MGGAGRGRAGQRCGLQPPHPQPRPRLPRTVAENLVDDSTQARSDPSPPLRQKYS